MVKKVDVATYDSVKSVLNDSFEPGVHNLGIKDGGIDYTRENSEVEIEEEIIEQVEDLKEKIKSGEIEVPDTIEAVESFLN
jgi:basic membrane protein A